MTDIQRIRDNLQCALNMGGLREAAEWTVAELDRMLDRQVGGDPHRPSSVVMPRELLERIATAFDCIEGGNATDREICQGEARNLRTLLDSQL